MPGQGRFHLIDGRMEILVEKAFGGDDPAGCTEAAICGYTGVPDALERMEIFLIPYSFDRENPLACGFGRQRMARIQRNAFNQDTTRAATSPVAASVRSSETQLDCDHLPQRGPHVVFDDVQLSVDEKRRFLTRDRRRKRQRCRSRGDD